MQFIKFAYSEFTQLTKSVSHTAIIQQLCIYSKGKHSETRKKNKGKTSNSKTIVAAISIAVPIFSCLKCIFFFSFVPQSFLFDQTYIALIMSKLPCLCTYSIQYAHSKPNKRCLYRLYRQCHNAYRGHHANVPTLSSTRTVNQINAVYTAFAGSATALPCSLYVLREQ